MGRIQHVKIISNAPEDVRLFLREVAEFPDGFDSAPYGADSTDNVQVRAKLPLPEGDEIPWDYIISTRGMNGQPGFHAGDTQSRQLQVFPGEVPGIWAVALSTRDARQAHAKSRELGFPTTPIDAREFQGAVVTAFFAVVGGITFELINIQPTGDKAATGPPMHTRGTSETRTGR